MATRGLVQGCPISPVIAAAIMHIWQLMVSSARVSSLAYQDDRTLILKLTFRRRGVLLWTCNPWRMPVSGPGLLMRHLTLAVTRLNRL